MKKLLKSIVSVRNKDRIQLNLSEILIDGVVEKDKNKTTAGGER